MRRSTGLARTRGLVLATVLALSSPGMVGPRSAATSPDVVTTEATVRSASAAPPTAADRPDPAPATTAPTREAMRADAELWVPVTVWTRAQGPRPVGIGDVTAGPDREVRLDAVRAAAARVLAGLDMAAPFAWRDVVTRVDIGCMAVGTYRCPGGVARRDELVLSPAAIGWTDDQLAYVLRHELAHVWQFVSGDPEARRDDLAGLEPLLAGVDPLEAAADCLAAAWGSPSLGDGYLDCPAEGVARMAEVAGVPATRAAGDVEVPTVGGRTAVSVA